MSTTNVSTAACLTADLGNIHRRFSGQRLTSARLDRFWSTSMRDKKKRNLLDLVVRGMSVVDCDGTHLGVVQKVEGGHLKILRADQAPRNRHQYVPPDWVVAVDDRVKINRTIDEAKRLWAKEPYAKRRHLERSM